VSCGLWGRSSAVGGPVANRGPLWARALWGQGPGTGCGGATPRAMGPEGGAGGALAPRSRREGAGQGVWGVLL